MTNRLSKEQIETIYCFVAECTKMDLSDSKEIAIGAIRVVVYKDFEHDSMYDVYTYKNEINADDCLGVHSEDLSGVLLDNISEARHFELL